MTARVTASKPFGAEAGHPLWAATPGAWARCAPDPARMSPEARLAEIGGILAAGARRSFGDSEKRLDVEAADEALSVVDGNRSVPTKEAV